MIYLFENIETGEPVEHDFPVGKAPRIGEEATLNGHLCRRVASFVMDVAGVDRKTHQYPYVSSRLPSTIQGCKMVKTKGGREKPMIRSRRHEQEVMARNDLQRDGEGV